jgi:hypothetical protein
MAYKIFMKSSSFSLILEHEISISAIEINLKKLCVFIHCTKKFMNPYYNLQGEDLKRN